jgi:hypothetical protein
MSIFIMDGVNIVNKRRTLKPLTINLPDCKKVRSTHACDIAIPGLPIILTEHIVLDLALASLIGICPLCKVGCRIIFDNHKCEVEYKGNVILRGYKDPSTSLWMLLITPNGCSPPFHNLPLLLIVPCIQAKHSMMVSTLHHSRILCVREATKLNLHTSHCVIRNSPHC